MEKPVVRAHAGSDFLTEQDWDFEKVPAGELIACCLWEYARESKTLGLAADAHWCNVRNLHFRVKYQRNAKLKSQHDLIAKRMARQAKAAGFDYGEFLEAFWEHDVALVRIYETLAQIVSDGAKPWQALDKNLRAKCVREVSESLVFRPLPLASVGELERLWNASRAELDEARLKPTYDDSEECALWGESVPVMLPPENPAEAPGKITAAFSLDFTRFTDGEICEAMKLWLVGQRPKQWKVPKRVFPTSKQRGRKLSGKQTEYSTALNRLGLMRLLHWFTPQELRRDLPKAWQKYQSKRDDFKREVREAGKFFHRVFPFLPEKERPWSEARKGDWLPEMLRIAEKVDREMGKLDER